MSLKLRVVFARSQNIICNFHRLAVRSSPCFTHSALFSTRFKASSNDDKDEDEDDDDDNDYADDIDTSPLDNLLRMKPAILPR